LHFLLFYEADESYEEKRKPFRSAHLEYARAAVARGELILGGAFAQPADGAALLFRCASMAVVERFAAGDPYVVNGVIRSWRVRPWTTVVGEDADQPVP
jgi:uncharacterized protein YciI